MSVVIGLIGTGESKTVEKVAKATAEGIRDRLNLRIANLRAPLFTELAGYSG